MRRAPPFLFKLLLSFTALGFAFLFGEVVVRLWFRDNIRSLAVQSGWQYYAFDADGVRRHIPNSVGRERSWDDRRWVIVRINERGFRGPPLEPTPVPGAKRVVFLGDSITFGTRLEEEESFVWKVERMWNDTASPPLHVINAGVEDIGLREMEDIFYRQALPLNPDAVVLDWFMNDRRPPVGFRDEVVFANRWISFCHRLGPATHSALVGWFFQRFRRQLAEKEALKWDGANRRFQWADRYRQGRWIGDPSEFETLVEQARFDWGDAWVPEGWEDVRRRMAGIRKTALSQGAPLFMILFPVQAQVYVRNVTPFTDIPQKRLKNLCADIKVPCLDLLPVLRRNKSRRLFYDQCHYTPEGNTLIAEEILNFLNSNKAFSTETRKR